MFDLTRFSRANDRLQRTRRSLYLATLLATLGLVIGADAVILVYAPSRDGLLSALVQFTGGLLIGVGALMVFVFVYRQLGVPASTLEIRPDGITLSTGSGRRCFVSWRQGNSRLSIQVRTADAKLPPEAHFRLVVWPAARGLRRFAIPFAQVIPYTYLPREAAELILDTAAVQGIPISVERNVELRENRKPVTVYRVNITSDTPVQAPYRRGEGLGSPGG